ncbi:MAG: RluA family pseudouridine synthase, partial [Oscillospiraceae bacterium]|nr:RluA family pseudouridine synthase [Oscillospiraceae bacterium]
DIIVINKPQGMVVHPAPGNTSGTLVNALMYHCGKSLSGINGCIRPGIVHRIDKDTSGLLVCAKNNDAHISLSGQLKECKPVRRYYALVNGRIKEDGTVDKPIARSPSDRKKMAVVPGGRSAVTHYKVIENFREYTLVECILETGRTHQIRVHLASIGHSIVGDKTYGTKKDKFHLDGQLLHAASIGFIHPSTGEYTEFSSDLPEYFSDVLNKLQISE